jgi:hypothetical protein
MINRGSDTSFTNLWSLLLYIQSLLHYIENAQENKKNTIYCITIIIMKYTHSHGVLELSEIYISGVGLKLYALELHTWGGLILYVIQLLVLA